MKPKVAFVCVHNSCRSQIAEALGKELASDVFESCSAGTETKPQINQDAVRMMKKIWNSDNDGVQCELSVSSMSISGGLGTGRPKRERGFCV